MTACCGHQTFHSKIYVDAGIHNAVLAGIHNAVLFSILMPHSTAWDCLYVLFLVSFTVSH
jgi:hypothetical protein